MNKAEIISTITEIINSIFGQLFSSIDSTIYSKIDELAFISPDIFSKSIIRELVGNSFGNGKIIMIANSLIISFSLYYICKLFLNNFSDIYIERPHQFIFRLLLFAIFINFSGFICYQIVNIFHLISESIQNIGKELLNSNINFSELLSRLNTSLNINEFSNYNFFSIDGLFKSLTSIGLLNILLNYSLRYILIILFIIISPFAFLSLINSYTNWIFKIWFKCIFSLLVIQVFIPIILIIIFSINIEEKFLFFAAIYLLSKINDYVRDLFGGINTSVQGSLPTLTSGGKK